MALLDEEVVEYWLNNRGFFCMRGVRTGLGEIDFLAIRPANETLECWHVEVTVSFRPMGYIGGGSNAKRRDSAEVELGVDQFIEKKYKSDRKSTKRAEILPNVDWRYVLVCAEVRHQSELEVFERKGIKIYRYKDILEELSRSKSQVNSTAGTIVEIIRYIKS